MSERYLGEHFDIHTGGADLAPIHHNNEIAQSECAHGHPFVTYWLHNAFVNVASGKMAKSEGTGITLQSIVERGFDPIVYRYWLLGGHYRTPMTFSWEALEAAAAAYRRLQGFLQEWDQADAHTDATYEQKFQEAVYDDINTPQALAITWELVSDQNLSSGIKKATILKFDKILGLKLATKSSTVVPKEVQQLATERQQARDEKRWNDADILRQKINDLGFTVRDTPHGPVVEKF